MLPSLKRSMSRERVCKQYGCNREVVVEVVLVRSTREVWRYNNTLKVFFSSCLMVIKRKSSIFWTCSFLMPNFFLSLFFFFVDYFCTSKLQRNLWWQFVIKPSLQPMITSLFFFLSRSFSLSRKLFLKYILRFGIWLWI